MTLQNSIDIILQINVHKNNDAILIKDQILACCNGAIQALNMMLGSYKQSLTSS
jgi:hypothetical protein